MGNVNAADQPTRSDLWVDGWIVINLSTHSGQPVGSHALFGHVF